MGIYEFNVRLDEYARPGAFNDPDMLEVGNGKLTFEENKSHFTLWSMMAAPLILGNDIRDFIKPDGSVDTDNKVLKILTNKDVIAINQDRLGIQCKRIKAGLKDVLVKPLDNNEVAVCFFNKTNSKTEMSCSFRDIKNVISVTLPDNSNYICKELWDKTEIIASDRLTATVEPHGVKVFKISANK
jgi:alpha-galactosidase